ncbi:hypothetical protein [Actinomadura formosensis]|uniref:hypothetical protein n=1 Tax=Actinomadura formosensis TaxID=60706 RepID=UPI000AB118D0|nr:hypothetical protein [Actinomadura formosensis]
MTAHLSDSDRQALRLAQDLREEMRAALPQMPAAPSVSPFVDQAGMPSVLLKMDAETARALMAVLAERRAERGGVPGPEPRHGDGAPVPPLAAPAVPAAQGPIAAALGPYGEQPSPGPGYPAPGYPAPEYPAPGYVDPGYADPGYAEAPFVPQQPGAPVIPGGTGLPGGTGPTPLVPSVYPTH